MKYMFIIMSFAYSLFAMSLQTPIASFKSSGNINDIKIVKNRLYSATDAGCVDIFNIKTKKIVKKIKVSKVVDFTGEKVDSKVYSVDVLGKSLLLVSQGQQGYSKVYLDRDSKLENIVDISQHLDVVEARFLNKDTILLALVSNELISYDIKTKRQNYRIQVSESKFSNFVFNDTKSEVVVADESGDLQILDTKTAKRLQTLSGENLDNVFQIDYHNGIIATAGKDRRIVVYNTNKHSSYYKMSKFFIYSVGVSPSGKSVAYSSDINNNVIVFNSKTKQTIAKLGGNKMTITKIIFTNERNIFVATGGIFINEYKIK